MKLANEHIDRQSDLEDIKEYIKSLEKTIKHRELMISMIYAGGKIHCFDDEGIFHHKKNVGCVMAFGNFPAKGKPTGFLVYEVKDNDKT